MLYIVLFVLSINSILNIIADRGNIKNLEKEIPEEYRAVWEEGQAEKYKAYNKEKLNYAILRTSLEAIGFLMFMLFGVLNYIDNIVRVFSGNEVVLGVLFTLLIMFLGTIINLPFSIYSTFYLEEKYGFNKTKTKTFIKDIFLNLLIELPMMALIMGIMIFFFEKTGVYSGLIITVFLIVFTLFMQFIYPKFILPLFNKFTKMEDGELKEEIEKYAKKTDYVANEIWVMDGSKRSSKANAFFTGFGKNKKVVLFDTLIEKLEIDEIVAVLAHEIGHFKKKHIFKMMLIAFVRLFILVGLLQLALNSSFLYDIFRIDEKSIYMSIVLFSLLYSPISSITDLFLNRMSRKHEYEADAFAVETIENKEALIDGLKKIVIKDFGIVFPSKLDVVLNYSHPPLELRIENMRKK